MCIRDSSYLAYYLESPWFKNGEETELPEGFYSSEYFVDQMIAFMEEDSDQDTPFFSYLSLLITLLKPKYLYQHLK